MKIESIDIVVDTYAWIEYFRGSKKGEIVKKYLLLARNIYTPSIVLAEIARKYVREGISEDIVRQRLKVIVKTSTITRIDIELAIEASKEYLKLIGHLRRQALKQRPSLNDAIILATARKLNAKIITGDQHFKKLEGIIWIGD